MKYFSVKIDGTIMLEDGTVKKAISNVLVQATIFGEAETKAYEYVESRPQMRSGGSEVTSIIPTKIIDVFESHDGDKYFLCKAKYLEDNGNDKLLPRTHTFLVSSIDVDTANKFLTECLKTYMNDYTISEVKVSQIIDVVGATTSIETESKPEESKPEESKPENGIF